MHGRTRDSIQMKRRFRTYLLAPAAAAILVIGMTGCNNQGNSPRDSQSEGYAPNGNGASPGAGVGTGGGHKAGSENGQAAGNSGSGGSTAASGNGGAAAGGSGGEASTPTSRP